MTASFISLFGIADSLTSAGNVIREIADDLGHGCTPRTDLLAEINDLEAELARLKGLAEQLGFCNHSDPVIKIPAGSAIGGPEFDGVPPGTTKRVCSGCGADVA